jgi:uncharacterized RDD family membrane protein YckC
MASVSTEPPGSGIFCTECGRRYPADDLARFGASAVCADCKPTFVQRLKEGGLTAGAIVYAGFWRRAAALMLDGIILMIAIVPFAVVFGMLAGPGMRGQNPGAALGLLGLLYLIILALSVGYHTYFVSRKGATPGKMVMGMKVITVTGEPVSVGRAVGRVFAHALSGMILYIGYIMVAFDVEKRALHDHICGTRVIRLT